MSRSFSQVEVKLRVEHKFMNGLLGVPNYTDDKVNYQSAERDLCWQATLSWLLFLVLISGSGEGMNSRHTMFKDPVKRNSISVSEENKDIVNFQKAKIMIPNTEPVRPYLECC